jgi:hypothetical protein
LVEWRARKVPFFEDHSYAQWVMIVDGFANGFEGARIRRAVVRVGVVWRYDRAAAAIAELRRDLEIPYQRRRKGVPVRRLGVPVERGFPPRPTHRAAVSPAGPIRR